MSGTLKINTRNAQAMFRELGRAARIPPEQAMVYEVGKILEATLRFTPAADVSKMRAKHETAEFSMQPATLYTPKDKRTTHERSKETAAIFITYYLLNRYPDALWHNMSARRKASLLRRLKARGISKQSWLQIADRLGVKIDAPGYVLNALATTGQTYPGNTAVRIARRSGRLQISFANAQPTVNQPRVGGARALQRAIDGRVRYFQTNVARGVFEKQANIAKRYPGMKVGAI